MHPPSGIDLFPASLYGWLTRHNCDINSTIEEAITQAAVDWFVHNLIFYPCKFSSAVLDSLPQNYSGSHTLSQQTLLFLMIKCNVWRAQAKNLL